MSTSYAFRTLDDATKDDVEAELTDQSETTVAVAADRFDDANDVVETTCRSGDPAVENIEFVDDVVADS